MSDGDGPEFWRSTPRKARKQHTCIECERIIEPGEIYNVHFGVQYGDSYHGKTCAQCKEAAEFLVVICNGYLHHAIHEDLCEHAEFQDPVTFPVRLLAIHMGNQWIRKTDGTVIKPNEVASQTRYAIKRYQKGMAHAG